MIKISRSKCPDVLKNSPQTANTYRNRKVVEALHEMQHGKCCYCEMEIPDKGHLKAVEHFKPKSTFKYLKNEWRNLLLACSQCNGKKADLFPIALSANENEPKVLFLKKRSSSAPPSIINPSGKGVFPEHHIGFRTNDMEGEQGIVVSKNHSLLGQTTIDVIGLDGWFYTKSRRHYHVLLDATHQDMMQARDNKDDVSLKAHVDRMNMYVSKNSQFSGYARSFALDRKLDKRFGIKLP